MTEQRITQDKIIDEAIADHRSLSLYLKSGVSVKGIVLAHDSYTVYMKQNEDYILVYKHFITSVFPAVTGRHSSENQAS